MSISIWEAIKEYRAASKSHVLSKQQKDKEMKMAMGKGIMGVAEKADKIPLVVGTLFGAGAVAGEVDLSTDLGFAMAGAIVVAKGLAALGKRHEFVHAYKSRNFLEEQISLQLDNDPDDPLNRKTKVMSTSMELLIGYNRAYNSAKRFKDYEGFIKFGKGVVTKAMALVEEKFLSSLETEEEKTWVDRFIKKPLNKLVPDSVRQYFIDAKEKRKLLNWVENQTKDFDTSEYKKLLDKEENDLFGSYKAFEKDLEKVFQESYSEILSSSIKTKFVDMVDEYFTMCHRFRDQDRLKEQFDKNLRDKFEKVADLYKETKNEKYYVISKLAESTISNVDTGVIKHIKGWNNSNEDGTNKKIITSFLDKVAVMKDKPRMLNIDTNNNPIITVFDKKLEAIIDSRSSKNITIGESEKRIEEAGFEPVVLTNNDRLQIKESTEKAERLRYLQNHYVSQDLKKANAMERREIQKEINEFDRKQNDQSGEDETSQERRRRKIS